MSAVVFAEGQAGAIVFAGDAVRVDDATAAAAAASAASAAASAAMINITTGIVAAPGLNFGGASVGMTYGTRFIHWTRIGNRLLFNGTLEVTNKGSSTGAATITGLPFPSVANGGVVSIAYYGNFASAIIPIATVAAATIALRKYGATSAAVMTDADFANTRIDFSGFYQVA